MSKHTGILPMVKAKNGYIIRTQPVSVGFTPLYAVLCETRNNRYTWRTDPFTDSFVDLTKRFVSEREAEQFIEEAYRVKLPFTKDVAKKELEIIPD